MATESTRFGFFRAVHSKKLARWSAYRRASIVGMSFVAFVVSALVVVPAAAAPPPGAGVPIRLTEVHDGPGGGLTAGSIQVGDYFGSSVSSNVGDIDGDGIRDVVVGAPLDDTGAADSGAVYVIFLNAAGTVKSQQKIANGVGGLAAGTNAVFDHFGNAVTGLGDIDGDGVPDIAVSAELQDSIPLPDLYGDNGSVRVLRLTAAGTVKAGGTTLLRQGLNGVPPGDIGDDRFGSSVAGLGDVNGDGVGDLAIGIAYYDENPALASTDEGAVMVVLLTASGTATAALPHLISDTSLDLPLNSLDVTDRFGAAATGPGDVNGDGVPDLAVGAPGDDDGSIDHGAVYVVDLSRAGSATSVTKISRTAGGFASPLGPAETEFGSSLGAAGDLDGNGVPDIAVGNPYNDQNGADSGAVFLLDLTRAGTVSSYVEFSDGLNGVPRGTLEDAGAFGSGVGGIGDFNGDGYPDIVVGARFDDSGGFDNGSVFVMGTNSAILRTDTSCAVGSAPATVFASESDGTGGENRVGVLGTDGRLVSVTAKEVSPINPAIASDADTIYNFALSNLTAAPELDYKATSFPLPTAAGLAPETPVAPPGTAYNPDLNTVISGAATDPTTGDVWAYWNLGTVNGALYRSTDGGDTFTGPYFFNAGYNIETQFVNDIAFTADGRVMLVGAYYTGTDGWRLRTYVMKAMPDDPGAPSGALGDPLQLRLVEESVAYIGHLTPGYYPSGLAVVDDDTMLVSMDVGGLAAANYGTYIVEYDRVGTAPNVSYTARIVNPAQTTPASPPPGYETIFLNAGPTPPINDLGITDMSSCRGFVLDARRVDPVCSSVWYDRIDYATSSTGTDLDVAIGPLNTSNAAAIDNASEVRDAYALDTTNPLLPRYDGYLYGWGLAVGNASGSLNAADTPNAGQDSLFAVPLVTNQIKQWVGGQPISDESKVARDVPSVYRASAVNPVDHTLWAGYADAGALYLTRRSPGGSWQPSFARYVGLASPGWDSGQLVVMDFMFGTNGTIIIAGYQWSGTPSPNGSATITLYQVQQADLLAGAGTAAPVKPIARSTSPLTKSGGTQLMDFYFEGLAADPDGRHIYFGAYPQGVSATRPYYGSGVYKMALANPSTVTPGTLTPVGTGGDIGHVPGWLSDMGSCYSVAVAAPATAPVITGPAAGSTTADNTPIITGTGEVGATVTVTTSGGTTVCSAVVAADGIWTCTPTAPRPDGNATLVATQSNAAGAGPPSAPVSVTIDTAAPAPPVISGPANGSTIADSTPTLTGTGEPGGSVTIRNAAGTTLCTAVATATGAWTCTPTIALPEGQNTLTGVQTDPAGNISGPSTPNTVTVDTVPPTAPTIISPANGATTNDATPTIAGTGEPGARVSVRDGTGTIACTAVVTPASTWSCVPSIAYPDGQLIAFTATQTDLAGATSPPSAPVTVQIDTVAAAPVISSPTPGGFTSDPTPTLAGTGEPGATVTVVDAAGATVCTATVTLAGIWSCTPATPFADGAQTVTAIQTDQVGNVSPSSSAVPFTVDGTPPAAPAIEAPTEGAVINDPAPTIAGTGEPGATVTVRDGSGTPVCSVLVGAGGAWSCTPATPLTDGPAAFTATQTDPAGNQSPPSPPQTITIDTLAAAPLITGPASGSTIADPTPTIAGTGESGALVTVRDGAGVIVCTVTVDGAGAWSCESTISYPDGPISFTATQIDPAGNTSAPSTLATTTVDTTAVAPIITGPADGAVLIDPTPTINGTGEPGATVTVVGAGGTPICTAVVDTAGNWSCTPGTPLPDGVSSLIASQTDPGGNVSPASNPIAIAIDTGALPPAIINPTSGTAVNNPVPTFSGTAEPGATVVVDDIAGTTLCTATANAAGVWSCTSATSLPEGLNGIRATQTDPAGNSSGPSSPIEITIDTTAPSTAAITGPANGSASGDSTPDITGSGEPGATITITDGTGNIGCTATVTAAGTWSCTPTTPYADGDVVTLTATQTDPAGNSGGPSDPVTVRIDTSAEPPVLVAPASGTFSNDNTPTFTGTGEPGATVTVGTDSGGTLCTATVNSAGVWSCTPTTSLPDATTTLIATQTDLAGNTSAASTPIVIAVDTEVVAPAITAPAGGSAVNDPTPTFSGTGEPGATVTVRTDSGATVCTAAVDTLGTWTCTPTDPLPDGPTVLIATQTDLGGNLSGPSTSVNVVIDTTVTPPVINGPTDGSFIGNPAPTITGTGESAATVTVRTAEGATVCTAVVDTAGTWTCAPAGPLPDGPATLTATQADAAGNLSAPSTPVEITIDTTAAPPAITGPANASTTADPTPTLSGTGEPGATVTIRGDDGATVCTDVVDTTGGWTCTPAVDLPDGATTLTATQTDPAGNISTPSSPISFDIDTARPAAPTISGPTDGSTLIDPTPTFTGNGETGATISITDGSGAAMCTTIVGPAGAWSCTPTTPLPDGATGFQATQTDPGGNISPPSAPINVIIDATAPPAPAITAPTGGSATNNTTPTFGGTGEPAAAITLTDEKGATVCTTTVDTAGAWLCTPNTPLPDGAANYQATQTDPGGNISPPSAPVPVIIDTVRPAAPTIVTPAAGETTIDPTPDIIGTGETSAAIVITDGKGAPVCTTTVGPTGGWSCTPSTPLPNGPTELIATQTDPAGNISLASPPINIHIEAALALIQGRVFADANADGILEPGDTDISGVTLELVATGPDSQFDTADDIVLATATTASPFTFSNVADGRYLVRVRNAAVLDAYRPTTHPDSRTVVVIVNQLDVIDVTFGYVRTVPTEPTASPIPTAPPAPTASPVPTAPPAPTISAAVAVVIRPGDVGAELPNTGMNPFNLLRLSVGFLLLGATLLLVAKRRSRSSTRRGNDEQTPL